MLNFRSILLQVFFRLSILFVLIIIYGLLIAGPYIARFGDLSLIWGFLVIFISGLIETFHYLYRHVIQRIKDLIFAVNLIEEGNYRKTVEFKENNELGILLNSINNMAQVMKISTKELILQVIKTEEKDEELEKINHDLENYIHLISHDLKSPLVSIMGFLKLFKKKYAKILNNEKALYYLDRIEKNSKNMYKMILDILKFSKTTRKLEKLSEINTLEVLNTLSEEMEYFFSTGGIKFEIEEPEFFPIIRFESRKLHQIFQNLILNAVQYIGDDEKRIIVRYKYRKEISTHEFQISDTGIGIPRRYFKKIFKLFQTVNTDKQKGDMIVGGTGVGLALVKRMLEVYEGQIWLTSEVGKGTTFYFTIPEIIGEDFQQSLINISTF